MLFNFFNEICEIFNNINIFEKSINQKDCHNDDFFTTNNFCEVYQTNLIFNEFQNSWECSKFNLEHYIQRTKHICLTKKIFSEYLKLKSESFFTNKNIKNEISTSIIFSGLNILTAPNPHLYELNLKFQSVFLTCERDEIEKFLTTDEIQRNLKRINFFYRKINKNLLLFDYQNSFKFGEELVTKPISEITTIKNRFCLAPEKKVEKTKIKGDDFLLLIPPCQKTKILMNNDLLYLLNWCVFHDEIILTKYLKRFTLETFYEFLEQNYSYLQIQYDEIIDVVDKRNLNKSSARMVIFNLLE